EPQNLGSPAYIVGVSYDGEIGSAYLRLYDPSTQRLYRWTDRTKHRPYCIFKNSMDKYDAVKYLNQNIGGKFVDLQFEKRFDALKDEQINVVRIITETPTDVAGRTDSIRNFI